MCSTKLVQSYLSFTVVLSILICMKWLAWMQTTINCSIHCSSRIYNLFSLFKFLLFAPCYKAPHFFSLLHSSTVLISHLISYTTLHCCLLLASRFVFTAFIYSISILMSSLFSRDSIKNNQRSVIFSAFRWNVEDWTEKDSIQRLVLPRKSIDPYLSVKHNYFHCHY